MSATHQRRISAAQLRLRMRHPFFATLSLFAPLVFTESLATAGTDGKSLFFNTGFLDTLDDGELDGLLVHEVLHAALLHAVRRGTREPYRWNIACDIVVNGMAREAGLRLPAGAVEYPPWADMQAEEVYARLLREHPPVAFDLRLQDLMESADNPGDGTPGTDAQDDPLGAGRCAALEAHWRNALNQARVLAARHAKTARGTAPIGNELEWGAVADPQLDWRAILWRHLVRTPTDFAGFDRRFVGRGLYIDAVEGESVAVAVCVDTSGSVGSEELGVFLSEIEGLLGAYPHVRCQLFFCDAELSGPHELPSASELPKPVGGGGTDFRPFFRWLAKHPPEHGMVQRFCVYLTDGYGSFPTNPPPDELLWVVTPGGLPTREFPFGEVARLVGS